jgi:DNA-binding response OmpR family regulator
MFRTSVSVTAGSSGDLNRYCNLGKLNPATVWDHPKGRGYSEIKGSEHTHNIRVVMLSPAGSTERTRGLDLGADDVLSLPFDSHELLSRVRSQIQNKYIADKFRERLRLAEENRNATQQVVTAVNEERRMLLVGGLVTVAVLIMGGLVLDDGRFARLF